MKTASKPHCMFFCANLYLFFHFALVIFIDTHLMMKENNLTLTDMDGVRPDQNQLGCWKTNERMNHLYGASHHSRQ